MASANIRVLAGALIAVLLLSSFSLIRSSTPETENSSEQSHVLTLDVSNFTDSVAKHPFILVEFYAPWCGHCKNLAPEYEKAASVLSKHNPPIVLAKVDANEQINKELASQYDVQGYPTLKILRNGGKSIQEYKGPREADGIVEYLKKQAGPTSAEIKSAEDAGSFIDDKKVTIVGVFPTFSGAEFESYIQVAEKLRSDYEFCHTTDAKFLPRGDSKVSGPVVRLFKPFDELVVDFQDFDATALEHFIQVASVPVVTVFNKDPSNHPFVIKFFNSPHAKAMLFMNFTSENIDAFKTKYHEVAQQYKGENISFLLGDLEASQGAFQFFGLKADQAPLIIVQTNDGKKFVKAHLEPNQLAPWLKEYTEGSLALHKKSEPIPDGNDEPVKVVVADNLDNVVYKSGKNVLLEFYAPWCGHCKKLAPILEEAANSLKDDPDVIIAKMDATANDVPSQFTVQGYPTLYFSSASGKLVEYNGGRTADEIIDFIQKNRDGISEPTSDTSAQTGSGKDEL